MWLGLGCSLVVEYLPNMYKVMDTIPSTKKILQEIFVVIFLEYFFIF